MALRSTSTSSPTSARPAAAVVGPSRAPVRFRRSDYLDGTDRPLARRRAATSSRRATGPPARRADPGADPACALGLAVQPDHDLLVLRRTTATLDIVVLEVTNTPWSERAGTSSRPSAGRPAGRGSSPRRCTSRRSSPWTSTTGSHRTGPGDALTVRLEDRRGDARSSTPTWRCAASTLDRPASAVTVLCATRCRRCGSPPPSTPTPCASGQRRAGRPPRRERARRHRRS